MKKTFLLLLAIFFAITSITEGFESTSTEENLGALLQKNAKCRRWGPTIPRHETYHVQVVIYDFVSFHIADYADGTRIVTCLDGPERGLQTISFRGIPQLQSTIVYWYYDHFVHYYPYAEVISFPNWQVSQFY